MMFLSVLLPRYVHRLWAVSFRYFWLPCPVCRQCFGGHELGGPAFNGKCVCNNPACVNIATEQESRLHVKPALELHDALL